MTDWYKRGFALVLQFIGRTSAMHPLDLLGRVPDSLRNSGNTLPEFDAESWGTFKSGHGKQKALAEAKVEKKCTKSDGRRPLVR